jgi:hypothetical protein
LEPELEPHRVTAPAPTKRCGSGSATLIGSKKLILDLNYNFQEDALRRELFSLPANSSKKQNGVAAQPTAATVTDDLK